MPKDNFNFSGLTREQIDEILDMRADLEADAIWAREEEEKFLKNNSSAPAGRPVKNSKKGEI